VEGEPTNRQLALACGGIVLGAAAGMTFGFLLVYVWLGLLDMPTFGDDPKGLGTVAAFVLPSIVAGAIATPIVLVRRQRRGRRLRWWTAGLGLLAAPSLIFWLRMLVFG